jgi:hypothetical protein
MDEKLNIKSVLVAVVIFALGFAFAWVNLTMIANYQKETVASLNQVLNNQNQAAAQWRGSIEQRLKSLEPVKK